VSTRKLATTARAALVAVAIGLVVGTASPATAAPSASSDDVVRPQAEFCTTVPVSVSGYLSGCFTSHKDGIGPWVDGWFYLCDSADETNTVRAQVVAAFSDGGSWQYSTQGWVDGAGCAYHDYHQDGPHNTAWHAGYLRISVQAPGEAENVALPVF
jgi:hypothetical protein